MGRSGLKGPLGAFGAMAGLAAASSLMPDGCAIDADESARLRALVPLLSPLVFVALGALVTTRRRTYAAVLLTLAACAVWAASVAFVYEGFAGLVTTHIAAWILAPFIAASLVVAPIAFRLWRRADGADSTLARIDRALVWSVCAAAVNVAVAFFYALRDGSRDAVLATGALAGTLVMAAIALAMARRVRRASRELAAVWDAPSDGAPYRAVPRADELERDAVGRRLSSAKAFAWLALLLAALGAAVALRA